MPSRGSRCVALLPALELKRLEGIIAFKDRDLRLQSSGLAEYIFCFSIFGLCSICSFVRALAFMLSTRSM